ncbi:hypothetical protein HanRHA438_Chr00c22g0852831 [Helianthus annuus]|nr:hypothetical protein HanIR_Chr02g0098891 [Helianthus annuus]KAJ0954217.1 hypothetical protein HanRHA438_Chr00c22g0852831 [Helianthus annuus]
MTHKKMCHKYIKFCKTMTFFFLTGTYECHKMSVCHYLRVKINLVFFMTLKT